MENVVERESGPKIARLRNIARLRKRFEACFMKSS
jgi:hypothetical protein